MSNRLYDILNTFNKLVAKDESKKQLTESAAKPMTKLEETMAKVEADFQTFKEAKKAKPDFLDVDKDGNKKEPMQKAAKDKKPDYSKAMDNMFGGNAKELTKNLTIKKKTNEADDHYDDYRKRKMADRLARGISPDEATKFDRNTMTKKGTFSKKADRYDSETGKLVKQNVGRSKTNEDDGFEEATEAAENPYQQRILDANKADLAEFLKTGYLDTTSDLYYQMYEYYANQMDPKTRRDQDAQYDFITNKIREVAGGVSESAAPGQEDWIRANKSRFIKQYGKDKGMEVLYATAWGRSKNESAYDSEVSAEDPVFEVKDEDGDEYGWDVKAPKEKKASTRQVAGKAYGGAAQKDDEEESSIKPAGEKRGRGRPAGSGKKMGAKGPTGKSKLMKEGAGSYRVTLTLKDDSAGPGETSVRRVNVTVDAADEKSAIEQAKQKLMKSSSYQGDRITGAKIQSSVAEVFADRGTGTTGTSKEDRRIAKLHQQKHMKKKQPSFQDTPKKSVAKGSINETADNLGEIAEDLQHVVDRLTDIGEHELAKQLQPIVWDLDDRDPAESLGESDYGWDYPEEKSKAPTSRKVAGTRYGGAAQKDDDEETSAPATGEKRGRGRPAGSGKKMGAKGPSGKSKLMSKGAVKEGADEGADMVKLAKVIASCTTPEQLEVAKKMAKNFLGKHRTSDDDFRVSAFVKDQDRAKAVKHDIRNKAQSLRSGQTVSESRPSLMDRLLNETYASFGEAESDLTLDQDQLRQHIGDENFEQLQRAIQVTGTYPEEMYDELFDYFSETGEIPLGAAHASDEDPYQWIHQKLEQMFGDEVGYDQENIDIDMGEPDEDYGTYGDDERPEEDEMNAESVNESKDMIAESLSRILHSYPYEVKTFLAGGDMDNDLYQALVDYYHAEGELPRQVMAGSDTMDWIADKFGTDLRNVELEEGGPKMSDVPAYLRKAQGQNFPLSRDQITPAEQHLWVVPGPGSRDFEARAFPNTPQGKMAADEFAYGVKGNVVLSAEQPVTETGGDSLGAELNELARLAGLKESIGECGEMSPFTQSGQPEQTSGMSINTNIDTRTGTKTMTVTADGEVADQLAKILSLSGLGSQVTARSSEVVGQDVEQEPEMQVVAVGEAAEEDREQFHASTTPAPEVAGVDAIVDQGDDLNRKKKQHADKPKLGDNPLATENFDMGRSLMRELESIKIKK